MKQFNNSLLRPNFILSFFFYFISTVLFGQVWTQKSKGIYGGSVQAIHASGTGLFVGTFSAGIFYSDNEGLSWKASNSGIRDSKWITSFASIGSTVFAGSYFSGVYASSNNGESWRNLPLPQNQILCLAAKGDSLFAGTYNGPYLSTDLGKTWTSQAQGMPTDKTFSHPAVKSITIGDHVIIAGLFQQGAYQSFDQGATWTPINEIPSDAEVNAGVVSNGTIYIGSTAGTFVSNNEGVSWTRLEPLSIPYSINSLATFQNKLYAVDGSVLRVWSDTENVWLQLSGTNPNLIFLNLIFPHNNRMFTGGMQNGILCSTDMSGFEERNDVLTALSITDLLAHNNFIFSATPKGLYRSSDNGKNWDYINDAIQIKSANDTLIASANSEKILMSLNDGTSWQEIPSTNTSFKLLLFRAGKIYILAEGKIHSYDIKSAIWQQLNIGDPSDWFSCMASIGNKLFAGSAQGSSGKIYFSKDDGITWTPTSPLDTKSFIISEMVKLGNNLYVPGYTNNSNNIYKTNDDGATWQSYSIGFPFTGVLGMDNLDNDLILSTSNGAIWSSDKGKTWVDINDSYFSTLQTSSFLLKNDTIYAATSEGLWVARYDFGPKISAFGPSSGPVGQSINLNATYLSPLANLDSIRVNGVKATISGSYYGGLTFTVPQGAKTGPISLTVGGKTVTTSTNFLVVDDITEVQESVNSSMNFYPNPALDKLNLISTRTSQGLKIKIHEITGKLIWQSEILHFNDHSHEIDISSLNSGLYILTVENNEGTDAFKFVKK